MLKEKSGRQGQLELVDIEALVPSDHLLRKIDKYINFSFINEICRPYYCEDNGRPAIEPVIMFKMLFLGYLYGIRSETRLAEEARKKTQDYLDDLNKAINEDRAAHGKKPLKFEEKPVKPDDEDDEARRLV